MRQEKIIPPKKGQRVFGGGKDLHMGIAAIEHRLGFLEVEMLKLVEMFAGEFPLKGPDGLFLRVLWINREGHVGLAIVDRPIRMTRTDGRIVVEIARPTAAKPRLRSLLHPA